MLSSGGYRVYVNRHNRDNPDLSVTADMADLGLRCGSAGFLYTV